MRINPASKNSWLNLLIAISLGPALKIYEFVIRLRAYFYQKNILKSRRLASPVISVGNLSFGGTGKTPCVIYIANFLAQSGYRVAILSRGYKRSSQGIVEVSDGEKILRSAIEAGDEPYLLAQSCPGVRVVVGAERYEAGKFLESKSSIDVFLLDDGYQHLHLKRDLNLLLIDGSRPLPSDRSWILNGYREPLSAIHRCDAVVITRCDQMSGEIGEYLRSMLHSEIPVFQASHKITAFREIADGKIVSLEYLKNICLASLAAIGNPSRFVSDLQNLGLNLKLTLQFEDHHRYASEEIRDIASQAIKSGAQAIITTEKDAANIPPEILPQLKIPIYIAALEFYFREDVDFKKLLMRTLKRRGTSTDPLKSEA